jgi:hypothetical protein
LTCRAPGIAPPDQKKVLPHPDPIQPMVDPGLGNAGIRFRKNPLKQLEKAVGLVARALRDTRLAFHQGRNFAAIASAVVTGASQANCRQM